MNTAKIAQYAVCKHNKYIDLSINYTEMYMLEKTSSSQKPYICLQFLESTNCPFNYEYKKIVFSIYFYHISGFKSQWVKISLIIGLWICCYFQKLYNFIILQIYILKIVNAHQPWLCKYQADWSSIKCSLKPWQLLIPWLHRF